MTNDGKKEDWQTGTWEGSRRAQLRAALRLTVRQRLEALEALGATSRHMAQLREQGAFHHGEQDMQKDMTSPQRVADQQNEYTPSADPARYRVHLRGCAPTPLASYLKALAIHRLVAEQKDPDARGWWEGEHFVLESSLAEGGLENFFLNEYRPTPIIAPWNGGSGFYAKDKARQDLVAEFEATSSERFSLLKEMIAKSRSILKELRITEAPSGAKSDIKFRLITVLRSECPDQALGWIDAAVCLTDQKVLFPPLLSKGGIEGRMDMTFNFLERIGKIFCIETGFPKENKHAYTSIKASIYSDVSFSLGNGAIGMLFPFSAGGPNQTTGFEADNKHAQLVNEWDYVFMLEGALLLASSISRKTQSEQVSGMSFPFVVKSTGTGSGSSDLTGDMSDKNELWLPIWSSPSNISELKLLFAEGRATVRGKNAVNGFDFAHSISVLGINRGVNSFQRFGIFERRARGQGYYIATPLNRFHVPRTPQQDLIGELDNWLWRVQAWARSDNASNRIRGLVQRLDNVLFDMAGGTGKRSVQAQKTLALLGEIQRYAGTSSATQEKLPPLPLLSERWFQAARDNSPEFRIASALAGLQGDKGTPLPFRVHLSPVDPRHAGWLPDGARNLYRTWHHGRLERNLLAVLEKRLLLASQKGYEDKPLGGRPGADLASISAFLSGATDDRRIGQLLGGLAHCKAPQHIEWDAAEPGVVPPAFGILKLVLTPDRQLRRCGLLAEHEHLPVPTGLVRLLAAGRIHQATRAAHRRLRIAGIPAIPGVPDSTGLSGVRLVAALLIPLSDAAIRHLHRAIIRQDERQVS